jgi:hypothetical protein
LRFRRLPRKRATAVAAAKVQIGKSLKFVGLQSIQLHVTASA